LNRRPWQNDHERAGGWYRTDVSFRAKVVIYAVDSVIPQAEVVEIMSDGMIVMKIPHGHAFVTQHSTLQFLKIGDKIPIRVGASKYEPMHNKIGIRCIPFIPKPQPTWTIDITEDDVKTLRSRIPESSKIDKRVIDVLAWSNPKGKTIQLADLTPGIWTLQQPETLADPFAVVKIDDTKNEKLSPALNVLRGFVNNGHKKIEMAVRFVELYKLDKSEDKIWRLYSSQVK